MILKYSKISPYKIRKIIKCFCLDLTAQQCSVLLKINRNTVNRYYLIFRKTIYSHQQSKLDLFLASQEISLSLFKNTQHKFPKKEEKKAKVKGFIGVIENEQIIFTNLIKADTSSKISKNINTNYLLTDYGIDRYDAIICLNSNRFVRMDKSKTPYKKQVSGLDNIERFWGHTKKRLNKFNGVHNYFELHLKESEWRWKKTVTSMEKELKKLLLMILMFFMVNKVFFDVKCIYTL